MSKETFVLPGLLAGGIALVPLLGAPRPPPARSYEKPAPSAQAAPPPVPEPVVERAQPKPLLSTLQPFVHPKEIETVHAIPARLKPSERVDGITVSSRDGRVFVGPAAVPEEQLGPMTVCYRRLSSWTLEDGARVEWAMFERQTELPDRYGDPPDHATMYLVSMAKLDARDDEHVTMEETTAWVDSKSLSARLVAKTSVPLTRLSRAPSVDLFAAREGDSVELVYRNAGAGKLHDPRTVLEGKDRRRMADRCELSTTRISADKPGAAEMASFVSDVMLGEEVDKDQLDGRKRVRFRELVTTVSLSRFGKEDAPTLSLSTGWTGPDQTVPR